MSLRAWSTILRDFGGVKNTTNAYACWEHLVLNGALPDSWLSAPTERMFEDARFGMCPHPASVGLCISFAIRSTRAQRLEAAYREKVKRPGVNDPRPVLWFSFTESDRGYRWHDFDDISCPDLCVSNTVLNPHGGFLLRYPRSAQATASGGFVDDLRWPRDPKHGTAMTFAEARATEARVRAAIVDYRTNKPEVGGPR